MSTSAAHHQAAVAAVAAVADRPEAHRVEVVWARSNNNETAATTWDRNPQH